MRTLLQDGLAKAAKGLTTEEELSGEMEAANAAAVQRELSGQGARVLCVERKNGGPVEESKAKGKS
ncbi:type II secretion system F family protein, partial [Aduncisulcus paluster]